MQLVLSCSQILNALKQGYLFFSFVLFSLLIPFVHREEGIGQQARDALLLCMSLSKKNESVAQYIIQHSNVCPVSCWQSDLKMHLSILNFVFWNIIGCHPGVGHRFKWPLLSITKETNGGRRWLASAHSRWCHWFARACCFHELPWILQCCCQKCPSFSEESDAGISLSRIFGPCHGTCPAAGKANINNPVTERLIHIEEKHLHYFSCHIISLLLWNVSCLSSGVVLVHKQNII